MTDECPVVLSIIEVSRTFRGLLIPSFYVNVRVGNNRSVGGIVSMLLFLLGVHISILLLSIGVY